MKVADLEGALLDYWVAQIERTAGVLVILRDGACFLDGGGKQRLFAPSLDWAHGGPILARMVESGEFCVWDKYEGTVKVSNYDVGGSPCKSPADWSTPNIRGEGETLLLAAMRAYVTSRFGDEVPDVADAQSGAAG